MRGQKIDPNAVEKQKKLIAVFVPRLRQSRRESGMMQKDLAKIIGTTESCVSRWMNGKVFPEAVYIPALATALNVSTDWLLGLDETDQKAAKRDRERLAKLELAFDVIKLTIADAEKADEN